MKPHFRWPRIRLITRGVSLLALVGLLTGIRVRAQSAPQVGYAIITTDSGASIPASSALFSYTNSAGVLVSQAGVAAAEPVRTGVIYVDEAGTRTGIALVNPFSADATITSILRDSAGVEVARNTGILPAHRHTAVYVNEAFPKTPAGFRGTLAFDSDQPLAAVTLREIRNGHGEPLYTTLPVVDASIPPANRTAVFPQIAAGGGYRTQLILINPSGVPMAGKVALYTSDGMPLTLRNGTSDVTTLPYAIPPHGTFQTAFDRPAGLAVGWAMLIPDANSTTPSGSAVFQYRVNEQIVTEAGVPESPGTTLARLFVDNEGTRTGVAIVNPFSRTSTPTPASLTIRLLDANGTSQSVVSRTLDPGNHLAIFAHELFPGLVEGFKGVMEISASSPCILLTLKLTTNSRGDQVLTTLPVADLTRVSSATSLVFPQIAIGGEFSTQLIFVNTDRAASVGGSLRFYHSDGTEMTSLGRSNSNELPFRFNGGGGGQLQPGVASAVPGSLFLIDPSTGSITSEISVNEGSNINAQVRFIDSAGHQRDDITPIYSSINPQVATVDASGNIRGLRAGFSTLTMSTGGVIATATISVLRVDSGAAGFGVEGIVQDLGRRLYFAAPQDHTILFEADLKQPPVVYAGTPKTAGLQNGLRSQSKFRGPAFLAIDQSSGTLFVADSVNNVIRRVRPGAGGVETFAGTGAAGSLDGPASQALFNNPQGVALDSHGYVWVVDSGNHTIRRIQPRTGNVETIAGSAGIPGSRDGSGSAAQFNSPTGIAVEFEAAAQQLEREKRGDGLPPVRVIVADTGNGLLRRVYEDGRVETIETISTSSLTMETSKAERRMITPQAGSLDKPTGVAIDSVGNIYVTEPAQGRVRALLRRQTVVTVSQPGTFAQPLGISTTETGKLAVGDSSKAAQQIAFGAPQISSVSPAQIGARGGSAITINGENFAPDSVVVVGGIPIIGALVENTQKISFLAPPLPSGLTTITIENRGGIAQRAFQVAPIPLAALPPGSITTVAGGTTFAGDGSIATASRLSSPQKIALDSQGNLYVADLMNNRVRKVDARTGIINTVAGDGDGAFRGDNGPAVAASLDEPESVALDAGGNIYIADTANGRIRRIDSATGTITTIAGGFPGYGGDGGPAASAAIGLPDSIAFDADGNLYFSDRLNHTIRRIDGKTTVITTYAGTARNYSPPSLPPPGGYSGDGGPATAAHLNFPLGIAFDSNGNLLIADDRNDRIRKVDRTTGVITTIAGTGTGIYAPFQGDNGPATSVGIGGPAAIVADSNGGFYFTDNGNFSIRRVSAEGIITTVAGNGSMAPPEGATLGPALSTGFQFVSGLGLDSGENLLIAEGDLDRIYKVSPSGILAEFAGIGIGQVGDGALATFATLRQPRSVTTDRNNNIIIADSGNNRIRKVAADTSIVTTIVGNGLVSSDPGDGGPAARASLSFPTGLTYDRTGNLFVAGWDNLIRRIDPTGIITTVAGMRFSNGFSGDSGPALNASFNMASGVAVAPNGDLYISDEDAHRIRKVAASTGIITTIAGTGSAGYSGDGGPATQAMLFSPKGLVLDLQGNLLIADQRNGRIRKINASTGVITTIAGAGRGSHPDQIKATEANLGVPWGVALDAAGNLYIAETYDNVVSRVSANTGILTILAGNSDVARRVAGSSGDGGPATAATLNKPAAIWIDSNGNLLIADTNNGRIRAIRGPLP